MPAKVCILTTVHPPFDTRIFHKQAKTLVKAGYDVTLIVQHDKDEVVDGVKIIALPKPRNRFTRIFGLTWQVFYLALRQRAEIYHFHDPELFGTGLILKFLRKRVIYDVHENYVTSIKQKQYLPRTLRAILSCVLGWFETYAARWFTVVLAERYYKERFPSGIPILNYPNMTCLQRQSTMPDNCGLRPCLLYTGNITEDRGALIHAGLVRLSPTVELQMIGRCEPHLATKICQLAGEASNRIHIDGVGAFVPYERIVASYQGHNWLAGLAIFPPTEHYLKKELTKFFEYMAFGIPILSSHFPVWKKIVEGNECGLTVDPLNPKEIAKAVEYLRDHPEERQKMGENGRRAVLEKYNWEKEGKRLLELYERLLT